MSDELEKLRHGNLAERFRYLYVTKLKKYRFMRRLRVFYGSDLAEALFLIVATIPALVFLAIALPYMHWKVRREQEEYQRLYENREQGWNPPP